MSTKTKYLRSTGEFFHIYNRGVDRNKIFFDDRNFRYFQQRVSASLDPSSLEINAYCLMPNHFHFIVRQLAHSAISGFMRSVCDGYAKAINKGLSRSGHLFEGKYKMKQIVNDTYLVHLSRYIHLNPVRAGLVRLPEEWQYSSCQVYFGMREEAVVSTQPVLEQFGSPRDYKKFVDEYVAEDRRRISNLLF
jgi:REP element-mobilizing transposase RayT